MIVTIHQPEFIPWLGYFDRIIKSDVFVLLDHVQYQKNGFINRNRIKNSQGWEWLTVPVHKTMKHGDIRSVLIRNQISWQEKHLQSLRTNYAKALYFNRYYPLLENILGGEYEYISELDFEIIQRLLSDLKVKRKIVRSSALDLQTKSNHMLVEICRKLKADSYLSGDGAGDYLDAGVFNKAHIKLLFQNFVHPTYKQLFPKTGFIDKLSIMDLLFNFGSKSVKLLSGQK